MGNGKTFYEIVGVPSSATKEDIERECIRLSELYRPDKNPNNLLAAKVFADVEEAYKTLTDPVRRAKYDKELLAAEKPMLDAPQQGAAPSALERPESINIKTKLQLSLYVMAAAGLALAVALRGLEHNGSPNSSSRSAQGDEYATLIDRARTYITEWNREDPICDQIESPNLDSIQRGKIVFIATGGGKVDPPLPAIVARITGICVISSRRMRDPITKFWMMMAHDKAFQKYTCVKIGGEDLIRGFIKANCEFVPNPGEIGLIKAAGNSPTNISNPISTASIADPASIQRTEPYLFEMLNKEKYLKAWNTLLVGETNVDAWLAEYSNNGNDGPAGPGVAVTVDGSQYQINSVCKTHDCGNNQFIVLFALEGNQAWGLLLRNEKYERFFGNPDEAKKKALRTAGRN